MPPYINNNISVYNNNTNIILSSLSNMPPCPGIILEKSLTLKCLLIDENTKSPNCPAIDKIIVIRISTKIFILPIVNT